MRTWVRSPLAERCGRCGVHIPELEPRLHIEMAGVGGRPKVRCGAFACANERVPYVIEPPAPRAPTTRMAETMTRLKALALGFHRPQREPGQEG